MAGLPPRWYVRGTNDRHVYDRAAKILDAFKGQSFCQTCLIVHADPVGMNWHIEGEDVDHMLCGLVIETDEGEVRVRPGKNICPGCRAVMEKENAG